MRGYFIRRKGNPAGKLKFLDDEIVLVLKNPKRDDMKIIFETITQYLIELNYQLISAKQTGRMDTNLADMYASKRYHKQKRKKVKKRGH